MSGRKKTMQERRAGLPDRGSIKASKRTGKPFKPYKVQSRRTGSPSSECPGLQFLFDWGGFKKFETQEQAEAWIAKELRSGVNVMWPGRWEYRIIDTREQSEGNREQC